MVVEVVSTEHLKVVFEDPSAWTLYIHRQGSEFITLGLHWNGRETPSSFKTLVEGTPEYDTFKEFFNAESSPQRDRFSKFSDSC